MHKKHFIYKILLILLAVIISILTVFFYDPLQVFRRTKYPSGNVRFLTPGLARNYNMDTFILGTSTSENILKEDVDKLLNKNSINLSLAGSTNYEQRRLLKLICNNKNTTTIIYGLDIFSLDSSVDKVNMNIPNYLFDDELLNKFKYFFEFQAIKSTLGRILGKNSTNIERMNYWGDQFQYSKEILLKSAGDIQAKKIVQDTSGFDQLKLNIDETLKIIESNKNIIFKVYFPPYASLYWRLINRKNVHLKAKEYFVRNGLNFSNLEIYDFQNDKEIIENFDNYRDTVHYGPEISKKIIEKIKDKKNLILDYKTLDKSIEETNKIARKN